MQIKHLDSYEQMALSDAARMLLCHFAAGDVQRPLYPVPADWEEVFQGVCGNGLLGLTQRYLARQPTRAYPPLEFRQRIQEAQRINTMRMIMMYRKIRPLLDYLTRSGLDYMVIKGPAVAYSVYPDAALRSFNDLDIVVRERDWAMMHQLLIGIGFKPEEDLPQPPPKLVPQAVMYELKYWHAETKLLVEVHYDDILNAGLAARDVEGFWQRATMAQVDDIPVKVMSLDDQLIHLCIHAHYHSYTRLNWLSDLAFIVRDHAARIDWERILKTVQVEEAQVGVYYSLYFLERLLGVSAPMGVMAALRPDTFRRRFHERYMPEEKILLLQPMSRSDFSFYFMPLFKRLLPDLLVMGRRREKLHYLQRLLLPPQDWLRYYYRLSSTQMIMIHYLLHPLKLAYHYLDEIVAAVARPQTNIGDQQTRV